MTNESNNIDAILDRAIENFARSIPAETIESNVQFELHAGMRLRIIRSSNGKCCAWCSSVAGEYYADEAPDDIYKRHDNCNCTVTYISEKGRQDAHTKAWIRQEEVDARRARIAGDQAYIEQLKQERKLRKISATGENRFSKGFTKKALNKHFGPNGKHIEQYPGWTQEKYNQEALKLVQSATSDDIIGYKTRNLSVVRYRRSTNDFVKGYPESGIATMFKPDDGEEYFIRRLKKERGIQK